MNKCRSQAVPEAWGSPRSRGGFPLPWGSSPGLPAVGPYLGKAPKGCSWLGLGQWNATWHTKTGNIAWKGRFLPTAPSKAQIPCPLEMRRADSTPPGETADLREGGQAAVVGIVRAPVLAGLSLRWGAVSGAAGQRRGDAAGRGWGREALWGARSCRGLARRVGRCGSRGRGGAGGAGKGREGSGAERREAAAELPGSPQPNKARAAGEPPPKSCRGSEGRERTGTPALPSREGAAAATEPGWLPPRLLPPRATASARRRRESNSAVATWRGEGSHGRRALCGGGLLAAPGGCRWGSWLRVSAPPPAVGPGDSGAGEEAPRPPGPPVLSGSRRESTHTGAAESTIRARQDVCEGTGRAGSSFWSL